MGWTAPISPRILILYDSRFSQTSLYQVKIKLIDIVLEKVFFQFTKMVHLH